MSKKSDAAKGGARGEGRNDSAELPHVPAGSDPYNSAPVPTAPVQGHRRQAVDEMRELLGTRSKDAATGERAAVRPASDLALRLAGMRVDLERVLSDMETLHGPAVDVTDRKVVALLQKLRESARHLEDAIDSLLPPDDP